MIAGAYGVNIKALLEIRIQSLMGIVGWQVNNRATDFFAGKFFKRAGKSRKPKAVASNEAPRQMLPVIGWRNPDSETRFLVEDPDKAILEKRIAETPVIT